ncbi:Helix-turn-helix domain protein [uncultured archaeon]|nr:Helix-turn-helix domain protein [uncultured archaeon]
MGLKVRINGQRLRSVRRMRDLTVTELAKRSGLSKNTLYAHEKGAGYASLPTVERLEKILHDSITTGLRCGNESKVPATQNRLARTGMRAIRLDNSPFDIVAKSKNYYEISLDANIRTLVKRASLFRLIKESFDSNYPFFVGESKKKLGGIPVIRKKDLEHLTSEEELLDMVYS